MQFVRTYFREQRKHVKICQIFCEIKLNWPFTVTLIHVLDVTHYDVNILMAKMNAMPRLSKHENVRVVVELAAHCLSLNSNYIYSHSAWNQRHVILVSGTQNYDMAE